MEERRSLLEICLSRRFRLEVLRIQPSFWSSSHQLSLVNKQLKVSRREYLKKREQKKLDEIRDDVEDEQHLFDGVKITEAEYRELSYKKQIYELVKKRSDEVEDTTEYRMPDAYDEEGGVNQEKRFSATVQRYRFGAAFGASFIWLAGLIYFPSHKRKRATVESLYDTSQAQSFVLERAQEVEASPDPKFPSVYALITCYWRILAG